jgi:hypothetical protein
VLAPCLHHTLPSIQLPTCCAPLVIKPYTSAGDRTTHSLRPSTNTPRRLSSLMVRLTRSGFSKSLITWSQHHPKPCSTAAHDKTHATMHAMICATVFLYNRFPDHTVEALVPPKHYKAQSQQSLCREQAVHEEEAAGNDAKPWKQLHRLPPHGRVAHPALHPTSLYICR